MVLPTPSTGFLLLTPVPVLPGSQASVYLSPFARNTRPTLLGLCNSDSSFKTDLSVTRLGRISHCLTCASKYGVNIFIPGFILNLVINMFPQVCLHPTPVHILPPDLRAETMFYSSPHFLATAWHAIG